MSILYRQADLSSGVGRTVHGCVVPYGQVAEVSDGGPAYKERFDYGAFTRSIAERHDKIKLFANHQTRHLPVGKAVALTERSDGLYAAFEVADTTAGRDALELVKTGVVDAFSVGFRGIAERYDGPVVVRTECALMEVSLTGMPAYSGATVAGVRSLNTIPHALAAARLRLLLTLER